MEKREEFLIEEEKPFDVQELLFKLLRHWYLFVVLVPFGISIAYLYLRYAVPVYSVNATVLIRDKKNMGGVNPGEFIQGLDVFGSQRNLENEIGILQSFTLIYRTLQNLEAFHIAYFAKGNVRSQELYQTAPFRVIFPDSSMRPQATIPFNLQLRNDRSFVLSFADEKMPDISIQGKLGETVSVNGFLLRIEATGTAFEPGLYGFTVYDLEGLALSYQNRLKVTPSSKQASIIQVEIQGSVIDKEIDFLNRLCEEYIRNELEEKNQIATNTINFINEQLLQISDSLQGVESQLEGFLRREGIVNMSSSVQRVLVELSALESEKATLLINRKYYDYLFDYLNKNNDPTALIAPSAIGIEDILLGNLIQQLQALGTQKVALSYTASEKSIEINVLNRKMESLRAALLENVRNILQNSDIALADVEQRLRQVRAQVDRLPVNERNFVQIQREFALSDNLYKLLLEKRAEAGIVKASTTPDNRILDKARRISAKPVSPQRMRIYLIALVLSTILPIGYVLLKDALQDKLMSHTEIEKGVRAPLLGSIAHGPGDKPSVKNAPKSSLAESFRSLRINLQFLSPDKSQQLIGVTSMVSGEGKTFCSYNLAIITALSGKRVVVIGADMRKPRLNEFFPDLRQTGKGLSQYLIGQATMEEVVQLTGEENMQVILSGPVPPNPAELLESKRMGELLTALREQYDYVFIDTPPVGLVADYFVLTPRIDTTIFVLRQGYTQRKALEELESLNRNKKFTNLALVFNDIKESRTYDYRYKSYGYGQGYYEERKPEKKGWLAKWRKRGKK